MHQTIFSQRLAALACATAALLLSSQSVQAGDEEISVEAGSHFGLGLGAGLNRKPYQGFDNKVMAMPLLTYENAWLRVMGPGVEGKLGTVGDFSFGLKGFWGFREGYKSSDADILSGMEERKGGIWIGPSLSWKNPIAKLSAEVLTDVSGHSQGQQARVSLARQFRFGRFGFGPQLAFHWQSDKVIDYYYGVRDSEVNAGRVGYQGKATVNVDAALQFNYSLARQQSLNAELGVRHYGRGITDSPLVDKSNTPIVRIGYIYMF